MKKITLFLIFILFYTTSSFSQENRLEEKKYYAYCMVYVNSAAFEMGLSEKYWLEKEPHLRNKKDKLIKFPTFVDAMNYLEALGWEMMQTNRNRGFLDNENDNVGELTILGYNVKLFRKEVTKEELMQISAAIQERL